VKVAVVGATGMLGHHTALALVAAGHAVQVVHRAGSRVDRLGDLPHTAAVADLDAEDGALRNALSGCDGAILCAGYYPTTPRPWTEEVARATAQAERFYQAAADAGVARVVYVGGSIALARRPDGAPADETAAPEAAPADLTPYVQVKWALDARAARWARDGLGVATAIPSMTFGEHDHGPTTGRLIVEIANRTLPAYVAGRRNAVYAGDAGRGIVRVCEAGRPGERYLLTGEDISMDDLVHRIARAAGVAPPRRVPLAVARGVSAVQHLRWRLGGPEPKLSATAIAVLAKGQFLDGSKAARDLGYRAEVGLDETIARALRWFRELGMARTG
jgi:dihydroflavonol-4-reductase